MLMVPWVENSLYRTTTQISLMLVFIHFYLLPENVPEIHYYTLFE